MALIKQESYYLQVINVKVFDTDSNNQEGKD